MEFIIKATFDTQKVFETFRKHIESQLGRRKNVAKNIEVIISMSEHSIIVKSIYGTDNKWFPLITFERIDGIRDNDVNDKGKSNYCHIKLSAEFDDPNYTYTFRDIICSELCGDEEFVESNILVCDGPVDDSTFKIDNSCGLAIGAETDMIAKLDFISEEYINIEK